MSFKCKLRISHHRMKQVLNKFRIKWCQSSFFFSSRQIISHPIRNIRANPSSTEAVRQHCSHPGGYQLWHISVTGGPQLYSPEYHWVWINHPPSVTSHTLHPGLADSTICMTKWAASWQNQQSGCAPSEDSDEPGHPPGLIRVFTGRSMSS